MTRRTHCLSPAIDESRVAARGENFAVINKLPGEDAEETLSLPGGGDWIAVHRLDQPVGGALLLARTTGTRAFLCKAFAEGRVDKMYTAIVERPPEGVEIPAWTRWTEVTHWLTFNHKTNKSTAHRLERPNAQKAVMWVRILGGTARYLFLEIKLVTGRHHQIRAQLAAEGIHVKGDLKYGARRSEPGGGIRLWATRLVFPLPPGESPDLDPVVWAVTPPLPFDNLWMALPRGSGDGDTNEEPPGTSGMVLEGRFKPRHPREVIDEEERERAGAAAWEDAAAGPAPVGRTI